MQRFHEKHMLSWMGRTVIDLPLNEIADFIARPESALIFDKYIVVSIAGLGIIIAQKSIKLFPLIMYKYGI